MRLHESKTTAMSPAIYKHNLGKHKHKKITGTSANDTILSTLCIIQSYKIILHTSSQVDKLHTLVNSPNYPAVS